MMAIFSNKDLNLILSKLDALLTAQANDDQDFFALFKAILHELEEIESILRGKSIEDFTLSQIGDTSMAITGVSPGETKTFQIGFVPPKNNIPLPTPPTATVNPADALVILSPVDLNFQFKAAVDPTETAPEFSVVVEGTNDKGMAVSRTFVIPIPPVVTPPQSITDFTLDQVS